MTELAEDIKALEDQALEKMRELEEKQALREKQRNSLYEEIKKVEEERRREADEARKQRQVELESAQQTLLVENQVHLYALQVTFTAAGDAAQTGHDGTVTNTAYTHSWYCSSYN